MKPHRVRMTHNLLLSYGLLNKMDVLATPRASPRDMTRFHSDEYIKFLSTVAPEAMPARNPELFRFNVLEDCPVFDGLWEYCQIAAGGSLASASRLNDGDSNAAINWAGGLHHAKKSEASGFCYINDCVLAILELLKVHARVLYVDIDIHHGDGVEEAFYSTDRVMTASFHKFGDYFPGTGDVTDIGVFRGKHYAANFPLRDGIDDDSYREIFVPVMSRIMEWYRPGAVVLQCGADSLSGDRLGCFNLSLLGHAQCVDFFKRYDTPLLLLGGGGYTIRNVARCWVYETSRLVGETISDEIPYNENYEFYGPEFRLHIVSSNMENHNSQAELLKTKMKIFENLRHLPHAPSVPMIDVPRVSPLFIPRSEDDTNTATVAADDDESDPDFRKRSRPSKTFEDFEGSDDEFDDQYISSLRHARRKYQRVSIPKRRNPSAILPAESVRAPTGNADDAQEEKALDRAEDDSINSSERRVQSTDDISQALKRGTVGETINADGDKNMNIDVEHKYGKMASATKFFSHRWSQKDFPQSCTVEVERSRNIKDSKRVQSTGELKRPKVPHEDFTHEGNGVENGQGSEHDGLLELNCSSVEFANGTRPIESKETIERGNGPSYTGFEQQKASKESGSFVVESTDRGHLDEQYSLNFKKISRKSREDAVDESSCKNGLRTRGPWGADIDRQSNRVTRKSASSFGSKEALDDADMDKGSDSISEEGKGSVVDSTYKHSEREGGGNSEYEVAGDSQSDLEQNGEECEGEVSDDGAHSSADIDNEDEVLRENSPEVQMDIDDVVEADMDVDYVESSHRRRRGISVSKNNIDLTQDDNDVEFNIDHDGDISRDAMSSANEMQRKDKIPVDTRQQLKMEFYQRDGTRRRVETVDKRSRNVRTAVDGDRDSNNDSAEDEWRQRHVPQSADRWKRWGGRRRSAILNDYSGSEPEGATGRDDDDDDDSNDVNGGYYEENADEGKDIDDDVNNGSGKDDRGDDDDEVVVIVSDSRPNQGTEDGRLNGKDYGSGSSHNKQVYKDGMQAALACKSGGSEQ